MSVTPKIPILLNSLMNSIYPDNITSNSTTFESAKIRYLRILNPSFPSNDIKIEALLIPQIKKSPNSLKIFELMKIIPKSQRNLKILYLLINLANSGHPKKSLYIKENSPLSADISLSPFYEQKSDMNIVLKEIKSFILNNSIDNSSRFFVINTLGNLAPRKSIHFPSHILEILFKTNIFKFHNFQLTKFMESSTNSYYQNFFKDFIKFNAKIDAFAHLEIYSQICFLSFLESTVLQFETINLVIHQLGFCYNEDMIMNCFLRNFYNPHTNFTRNTYLELLIRLNPIFSRKIRDFIFNGNNSFNFYKIIGPSKKQVFNEIEIYEQNLPFKLLDRELIKTIANIKQLIKILSGDFNINLSEIQNLLNSDLQIYDENSVLIFKSEIYKICFRLQEILSQILLADGKLIGELKVYKSIILFGQSSFMENIIEEYQKLKSDQMTRMHFERVFTLVYQKLGLSFQPYYNLFEVIFYTQMGNAEKASNNLFLKFNFSDSVKIIASSHFQENSLRLFNFFLKLKDFAIIWQNLGLENRKIANKNFHILHFFVDNFFKVLFYFFFFQVVEVFFKELEKKLKNAQKADTVLSLLNKFIDNIIDFCFLNYSSSGQRFVFQIIEALISRFRGFSENQNLHPKIVQGEIRAFKKMHGLICRQLIDLEAIRPKGVYVKLRFQLEFNNWN